MKDIIRIVEACLRHFNLPSPKIVKSLYSAKTHIRTHDILRASPSQSPKMLKLRISHRLSTHYSKSTPLTLDTQYQATVTWSNGQRWEFSYGTLYQAVEQVGLYLTIGTSIVTLQRRSSPVFPHKEGSFLLFSERWPNVISTTSILRRTLSWQPRIRHHADRLTVEIHSSGRAYSRPSTTT